MRAFLLNVSFFTRLPVARFAPYTDERYEQSIKFFPYVGLIIGAFTGLPMLLPNAVPPMYKAILSILIYLGVSGGIHLDGFADSLDGLLSGRTGERIFEIMKDSRMGAFGTMGMCLYFLIAYTFFQNASYALIFLMPYIGKMVASMVAGFSNYPPGKTGMGKIFLDINTKTTSVAHFFIALALGYVFLNFLGITAIIVSVLLGFWLRAWCYDKIKGLSGDSIGFIVEACQIVFVIVFQILSIVI